MENVDAEKLRRNLQLFVKEFATAVVGLRDFMPTLREFAVMADQIGQIVRKNFSSDALQQLVDVISSIPSDIKKTQLYADALDLKQSDLHYEDLSDWIDLFQFHSAKDVKMH